MADTTGPDIDTTVPHAARVYDYLLGGNTNFAVDREAAEQQAATFGGIEAARAGIRANRVFLGQAVRYMAGISGIRQFLDIGTGIPNADNVHAVAQQVAPESRIVYVDNDPIVLAHAHQLLESTPEGATAYINGNLHEPAEIFDQASRTLDFDEPVGLLLIALLHLVGNDDNAYGIVTRLVDELPSGSYLAISHMASDIDPEMMAALADSVPESAGYRFAMRSRDEVSGFFRGLDLVLPGLVPVDQWLPAGLEPPTEEPAPAHHWGGVGRKA